MFPDLSDFDPPFPPPIPFGVLLPTDFYDFEASDLDDLSLFTPALALLPDLIDFTDFADLGDVLDPFAYFAIHCNGFRNQTTSIENEFLLSRDRVR